MQSCQTVARFRRLGFDEPCCSWHVVHSPMATDPCWKTYGPRLSLWQVRHGVSPARVVRSDSRAGRPCGSWHDVQFIPPRPRRCAYGLLRNEETCGAWQVLQSTSWFFTSRCASRGSEEWMEWQLRQLTVAELACIP